LKKILISFYLLLAAALLLLPVPGEVLKTETQPSGFPASAAPPFEKKERQTDSPAQKSVSQNAYGELTRLYAPPVPGMSASPAKEEGVLEEGTGVHTANIPPGQVSPQGSYLPSLEEELLQAVNDRRAQEGCPLLEADSALQRCARLRAKEMVHSGRFSHTRPDGSLWSSVLPDLGESIRPLRGEIFGTALGGTPRRAAARWLEEWDKSPSERENICLPEFDAIGIGVYSCMEDGKRRTCAVLLFSGEQDGKNSLLLSADK
jgi:uncharacterized protein YkwD